MLGESGPPPEQMTESEHDHSCHMTVIDWVSDNAVMSGAIAVSFSAVIAALLWVFKRWAANKWPKRASDD